MNIQEFTKKVEQYHQEFEQEEKTNEEEYCRFYKRLEKIADRLRNRVSSEAGFEPERGFGVSSQPDDDPPIDITIVKKLLEKLKSLIPQHWWSGRLRDLLDKILQNLSPQNPEEFQILYRYIEDVYVPALGELLTHSRQEMKLQAYENYVQKILADLLESELDEKAV